MASVAAFAGKATVCTVTVNSADEREAFRQYLPEDKYQFVELVERGRPDWLASACRQQVRCDMLIVSGHFAGSEFYSSKFDVDESLPLDEMERAACSASCPELFAHLKEVYLFGCDSLKAEPVKSAAPEIVRGLVRAGTPKAEAERIARTLSERHAEASRDRMRRVFSGAPVIYGFSSLAPYGRVAGPMLNRLFQNPDEAIGSGRPSARLLSLFAPSSMVLSSGQRPSESHADYRAEACRYYDDALTPAQRLGFMRALLRREMPEVRIAFDRIEKFFGAVTPEQRAEAPFAAALDGLVRDQPARENYLAITRATQDPALRVRMISLARGIGWLSAAEQNAELAHTIHDVLAGDALGFGEVELICTLNRDRALDPALNRLQVSQSTGKPAQAAALACLGSTDAHARVLKALASPNEDDVQVAQAYLRHRPITDASELRDVARGIARMRSTAAQARALEALARLHVTDREVLGELTGLYAQAPSAHVQRAIAEVFLRAGAPEAAPPDLATVLRKHRIKPPSGGEDLIDVLLRRLAS